MIRKISEKFKTVVRNCISGIKIVPLLKAILPYNIVFMYYHKKLIQQAGLEELPEFYNPEGEKMHMVYMAGNSVKYCLTAGQVPRYLFWNHWDTSLPVHFYGYLDIAEARKEKSNALKCLFLQESRVIIPRVYEYIQHQPKVAALFHYIFTSDNEILEKYQNAYFLPAGGVWYGTRRWGGFNNRAFRKKM